MENYPNLIEAVSHIVHHLREEAGLSKRKLSELSSIDRVYILQIEQGKYRLTLNTLFFLAKALRISPSQLVSLIEKEQKKLCRTDQENARS